jgi:hypothetical protein
MMGHKTEKVVEQDRISCKQAQEIFYGLATHKLSSADIRIFSLHEASCPTCGPEFREWSRLRNVLQSSRIAPAADFKAGVMERIRETRLEPATRRSASWSMVRQHGWARGLVAAAVILIMLTGAAKLPALESLITQLTRPPVTIALRPDLSVGQGTVLSTGPVNVTTPVKQTAHNAPDSGTPSVKPQAKGQETAGGKTAPQTTGAGQTPEQYAFASKPSVIITTTTIKITVDDLEQAHSKALSIATSLGADLTSEQPAQDSSSNLLLIHFTIDPGQASAFLNRLGSLGGVVSKDKETDDVTGDYGRVLNAYQALLAQQSAAADSDKNQYTSQIMMLNNELQNWQDASEKQVIMLWLMQ